MPPLPLVPPPHRSSPQGGLQANLRAFTSALAPVLYAQLYTKGVSLRPTALPGAPYLAAAVFTLFAEVLHQRLRSATEPKEPAEGAVTPAATAATKQSAKP